MDLTAVAVGLGVLALLDGSFAGFRSSLGRTGLVEHRRANVVAGCRGAALGALLLAPTAVLVAADAGRGAWPDHAYAAAGSGMLVVYVPYASLVLLALAAYLVLGWQAQYLASALILGPFTLLRPLVALIGSVVGVVRADDLTVAAAIILATAGVLLVEPLAGRLWRPGRTVVAPAEA